LLRLAPRRCGRVVDGLAGLAERTQLHAVLADNGTLRAGNMVLAVLDDAAGARPRVAVRGDELNRAFVDDLPVELDRAGHFREFAPAETAEAADETAGQQPSRRRAHDRPPLTWSLTDASSAARKKRRALRSHLPRGCNRVSGVRRKNTPAPPVCLASS